MKVSFVINEPIQSASGGYKVVYTYANEMARKGIEVKIYYHCRKDVLLSNYKLPIGIKLMIARGLSAIGPKWFELDKKVGRKIITNICNNQIEDADIIIATAADAAKDVYALDKRKGKKLYFIQGYEDWVMPVDELIATYKYDMRKIVVSRWLKKLVESYCGENVDCVLNGINRRVFYVKKSPEERKNKSICMLYHDLESKGSKEGLEVIYRLKEKYPDLEAHLFGVVDQPSDFPSWISYTHNASQEQLCNIYNESMIYLCPSWNEGFGLTGAESMMCGCALVSTATDGAKEYATDDTAFLCAVHDIDKMFQDCCLLFDDNKLRSGIANKGVVKVTNLLDYNNAVNSFISILENVHKVN